MTSWLLLAALLVALAVVAAPIVHGAIRQARTPHNHPPASPPRHRRATGHDPAETATAVIRRIDPTMLPTHRRHP